MVTYRVRATSRFREYFLGELAKKNPPSLTRDSAPFAALKIPNSARPPAPGVQYLMPTFRWFKAVNTEKDQFASLRIGGGLRAYLDGPWFASGAGELLGVILPLGLDDRLNPLVSQWSQDPIWTGANLGFILTSQQFAGSVSSPPPLPFAEAAPGQSVSVLGFPVKFDGQRWYSDIQMLLPFYFPFVRLALTRFQPESLAGAHLSRVVPADFMQLPPHRLTLRALTSKQKTTAPKSVRFSPLVQQDLHLQDVVMSFQNLMEKTAPVMKKPNSVAITVAGVTHFNQAQNVVRVALQRATSPRKSELDWEPASEIIELAFFTDTLPPTMGGWRGELPLPADFKPGSFRVVVTELEQFISDQITEAGVVSPFILAPPKPQPARVVYADTIEI